jgi:succinyl-CoA synthetase alpha subunit
MQRCRTKTNHEAKVGIMPVFKKGIVSKSGNINVRSSQPSKARIRITTAIGIGGDPIIGNKQQQKKLLNC